MMKLHVARNQAEQKGIFGGSKGIYFSLNCRIELNDAEKALIEKYKQWDIRVYSYENEKGLPCVWLLREISGAGETISCKGVAELLHAEEEVKNACNNIKVLLTVMASFGGEEVIEI